MNKKEVIIIGSAGHSKVIIDIFEKNNWKIWGFLDVYRAIGEETKGYKVIGKEDNLKEISKDYPHASYFIAIGDNWIRQKVRNKIYSFFPEATFANAIHPNATIGNNVSLGVGIAIMAGAVINSGSTIEDFTIINTRASLDHDGKLSKFSSLAPNAVTGGNVTIGECSAVSIGATVKHGVTIGNHTVVGASALLLNDCGDNEVVYGIPAKKVRNRAIGEQYL